MSSSSVDIDKSPFGVEKLLKKAYSQELNLDYDEENDFYWSELESLLTGTYANGKWVKRSGVEIDGCKIEFVDSYGGEGLGDTLWLVVSVLFPDLTLQHYMKSGYHVSHDGSYWDGEFTVVKPKAVTKIEWEE